MGDCCAEIKAELAALRAEIANIPRVNEARIVQTTRAALQPDISSAVTGGIAVISAKLEPKISQALGLAGTAKSTADDANLAASLSKRRAELAIERAQEVRAVATDAKSVASEAKGLSNIATAAAEEAKIIGNEAKGLASKLGSVISKVESLASDALSKALKAVGISEQALAKYLGLAARFAELFAIAAQITELIQQVAILETLGGRIDAVENEVQAVGRSVSDILGRLLGLRNKIEQVGGIANIALNTAKDALSEGSIAQGIAGRAEEIGNNAGNIAIEAQSTANNALSKADGAQTTASQANSKASNAESLANKAGNIASNAFSKAGEALTTALFAVSLYQGIKSLKGLKGDKGDRGLQGLQGLPGLPGKNGITQTIVVQVPGQKGDKGERGLPGIGVPGKPGKDGRNGIDAMPYNDAGLKAFIAAQHSTTRASNVVQHTTTRITILTPIMAVLTPVLALLKQIYDLVSKGAGAAQLALLNIINNKLGNQVVGGLSGLITNFQASFDKLTEWLHIDRALNFLTFILTVQNAYFLCDSLKVVTLQMISDCLAVFGIKDKDNNPLNLNEILGHEIESLLKSMLGEQELSGMKKEWQALNRIYQAATNIMFAMQNMIFSVINALNVIGSWNAQIGNALKKYGVVGFNAFGWMNVSPNFHNKFFTVLLEATNVVSSLDFVAQSILSGRQAIDSGEKQLADLNKALNETTGNVPPENKPVKEAASASKAASVSPSPSNEDILNLSD